MQITTTADNARRLRHELTAEENRLWQSLRGRRFARFKFRRQHPIGPYVLDFYCHRLKFAIEIDGAWHEEVGVRDDARSAELATYGIRVFRLTNHELTNEWPFIEDRILFAIEHS
jgi:very-short-patch-repair endonuclease